MDKGYSGPALKIDHLRFGLAVRRNSWNFAKRQGELLISICIIKGRTLEMVASMIQSRPFCCRKSDKMLFQSVQLVVLKSPPCLVLSENQGAEWSCLRERRSPVQVSQVLGASALVREIASFHRHRWIDWAARCDALCSLARLIVSSLICTMGHRARFRTYFLSE